MSNTADIQQILSTEDPEFREWIEEHHRCENRLNELCSKKEVSVDEEVEEKTLKKRKLHLKDQMAERIRSYETSHVAYITRDRLARNGSPIRLPSLWCFQLATSNRFAYDPDTMPRLRFAPEGWIFIIPVVDRFRDRLLMQWYGRGDRPRLPRPLPHQLLPRSASRRLASVTSTSSPPPTARSSRSRTSPTARSGPASRGRSRSSCPSSTCT